MIYSRKVFRIALTLFRMGTFGGAHGGGRDK